MSGGIEGERPRFERTPQQSKPTEQLNPHYKGGNGSLGLPRTIQESAKPPSESRSYPTLPQKSSLNRAVEKTRDLYERNGWVFLPLGEVGKGSPGVPTLQGEQQPHSGGINKPELHPPKELPLPFEQTLPSQEPQGSNLSVADQVIFTKFQEDSELLSRLPHPLAPEMNEEMWNRAVEEAFRNINWEEMQRGIEKMDEEIMEALQDPIQRKKLLEGD